MSGQSLGSRAILGRMFRRLEQGATGWVDRLSFMIDSDQAEEEHRWLGMTPQLREWTGGRLVHGLRDFGIRIRNNDYEASIEVGVPEVRRDKTAQIMQRVDGLSDRANMHPAKLLSEMVEAGASTPCYDGQFFFDTDHSEGSSGAQSNDISIPIAGLPTSVHGSVTDPATEEMQLAILRSIQQMYGFKDDQGEPINEGATDFLVMVPTTYWQPAVTAVRMPSLSQGQSNVIPNLPGINISVLPNPRLSWTDKFATFRADVGDGTKPFIKQEEVPLNVKSQAEESWEEFNNNRWVFGVDWTGGFGYGAWQHAVLTTLT